jgi:predicted O-linked N-acetylglucosamine transferase (SPINDLY family)
LFGCSEDQALHLRCARRRVQSRVSSAPPLWRGEIWRNDRIRVAYISADFRMHATSYLVTELFELHDRSRFEVVGISLGPDDGSDMRARVVAAFDHFIDVRMTSDLEAAQLLHDLRIDLAVDMQGHQRGARPGILALRPAPIQACYLGFPGTTGADFIDYIVADPIVLPFDRQPYYTEKIVHLPECYQVNDRRRLIAPLATTREQAGLPSQGFVFCSFNGDWKITPAVFDIWMRLLQAVEGSVLWLLRDNATAEANLRGEAASRGIDPARLVFAERIKMEEHLARHRLADLFLDTFPCNAHTTASDALWAGLPLLTTLGETFSGRVAASLLMAVGLSDLVTRSLAEYEVLALRLAREPDRLRRYRDQLRERRPDQPLFDTDRFRRHIEAAYVHMWERWQEGKPPESFAVKGPDRPFG